MLELGLDGKVAVVTGGSDGMGLATASRLVSEGARVAICARRAKNLERAADRLRAKSGGEVFAQAADVTSGSEVDRFIHAVLAKFGGVDILINNAGASAAQSLEALDDDAWMADIELKVMGAVRFCRGVVPSMRERGGGAIVNATIGGGKAAPARALPTSVTRAAGINLTKSLANELAADNIRVNTICIGLIKSEQWVAPSGRPRRRRQVGLRGDGQAGPPGPRRRGGGVRGPDRVPRVGARRVHHGHGDQPGWRALSRRLTWRHCRKRSGT